MRGHRERFAVRRVADVVPGAVGDPLAGRVGGWGNRGGAGRGDRVGSRRAVPPPGDPGGGRFRGPRRGDPALPPRGRAGGARRTSRPQPGGARARAVRHATAHGAVACRTARACAPPGCGRLVRRAPPARPRGGSAGSPRRGPRNRPPPGSPGGGTARRDPTRSPRPAPPRLPHPPTRPASGSPTAPGTTSATRRTAKRSRCPLIGLAPSGMPLATPQRAAPAEHDAPEPIFITAAVRVKGGEAGR